MESHLYELRIILDNIQTALADNLSCIYNECRIAVRGGQVSAPQPKPFKGSGSIADFLDLIKNAQIVMLRRRYGNKNALLTEFRREISTIKAPGPQPEAATDYVKTVLIKIRRMISVQGCGHSGPACFSWRGKVHR